MGEGLDDQPDPHDVAEADPAGHPAVGQGADQPTDRADRGDQPEADAAQAEVLGGVEDEHRPGRAEGDVEDQDREHQRADRGVVPGPAEALDDVVPDRAAPASGSRPCGGSREARRSGARPGRTISAWAANGDACPTANSAAPIGGAGQLVDRDEAGLQPGVADRQVVARARASAAACSWCCRRTPRRCRAGTSPPAPARSRRRRWRPPRPAARARGSAAGRR